MELAFELALWILEMTGNILRRGERSLAGVRMDNHSVYGCIQYLDGLRPISIFQWAMNLGRWKISFKLL